MLDLTNNPILILQLLQVLIPNPHHLLLVHRLYPLHYCCMVGHYMSITVIELLQLVILELLSFERPTDLQQLLHDADRRGYLLLSHETQVGEDTALLQALLKLHQVCKLWFDLHGLLGFLGLVLLGPRENSLHLLLEQFPEHYIVYLSNPKGDISSASVHYLNIF